MNEIDTSRSDRKIEEEANASSSFIHRTDLVLAILVLAVCGYLFYLTTGFERVAALFAQDIQPEFFPRLLIWTIVFLSMFLPVEHYFLKGGAASLDEARSLPIKPLAWLTMGLLLLIVGTILWVGTIGSMIIVSVAMPLLWGERRLKAIAIFAVIFPFLITLLFNKALGVHFEPGLFEAMFGIY